MDHKWEQSAISPGESKSNKSIKISAESLAPSEYNTYIIRISLDYNEKKKFYW